MSAGVNLKSSMLGTILVPSLYKTATFIKNINLRLHLTLYNTPPKF